MNRIVPGSMLKNSPHIVKISEEGFSLIELIIVVVIIGVLAAIAAPLFVSQQKAAIVTGMRSDVRNTNLNIATYLTEDSTAQSLNVEKTGDQPASSDPGYEVVISDLNTTIKVTGSWDGYSIEATNAGIDGTCRFLNDVGDGAGSLQGDGDCAH